MAASLELPPGVPSDEELVIYYLRAKLLGQDLLSTRVQEEDLYEKDPEVYVKNKEEPVYFFTKRNRRWGLKYWRKRKAGAKYWKHTDQPLADVPTQIPVTDIRGVSQELIGYRRTLIRFNGEEKTKWRMHEYIIPPGSTLDSLTDLQSDALVLCKIFRDVEGSEDSEDEQPHAEESDLSVESNEHPSSSSSPGITPSQDPMADTAVRNRSICSRPHPQLELEHPCRLSTEGGYDIAAEGETRLLASLFCHPSLARITSQDV